MMLFPLLKVKIKVHMSELKYIRDSRLQGNPIKQHAYWVTGMVKLLIRGLRQIIKNCKKKKNI